MRTTTPPAYATVDEISDSSPTGRANLAQARARRARAQAERDAVEAFQRTTTNRARSALNVAGFTTDGLTPGAILATLNAVAVHGTRAPELYRGRTTTPDTTETDWEAGLRGCDVSEWLDSVGL